MGNNSTGSIDMAACEAHTPTATDFTLTADKLTLSIPQKEEARVTAAIVDEHGMPLTGQAFWTVEESDMQGSVIITPDDGDSHKATVTLTDAATAGTS